MGVPPNHPSFFRRFHHIHHYTIDFGDPKSWNPKKIPLKPPTEIARFPHNTPGSMLGDTSGTSGLVAPSTPHRPSLEASDGSRALRHPSLSGCRSASTTKRPTGKKRTTTSWFYEIQVGSVCQAMNKLRDTQVWLHWSNFWGNTQQKCVF